MTSLAGFIVAMLLTMVLMPFVKQLGYKFQIVDIPNHRKVHSTPIPRIGGVAIVLGAAVPLLIWLNLSMPIKGYLAGALVILVFGILDDRHELGYKVKFGAQFLAAFLVTVYGGLYLEHFHILSYQFTVPYPLAVAGSVFFILAAVNAINFSDGLDGLAGGVVLISLTAVMVLAIRVGAPDIVLICAVLIGSLLGFLLFNSHPAQIFMGDSGSQFLGFSLSVLTMYLVTARPDQFSTLLPLALIGLPIADVFLVIVSRLVQGSSPFKPDKNHIHHRLMSLGLKQYGSVFVIYSLQGVIISIVMMNRYNGDTFYILFFPVVVISITAVMLLMERFKSLPGANQINALIHTPERSLRRFKKLVTQFDLARWSRIVAIALMVGYLLFGTLVIEPVTLEIGVISAALFLLLLVFQPMQITEKLSGWFTRFIHYLSISGILFLVYTTPGVVEQFRPHVDILFVMLALLVIIGIEYSDDAKLNARPIDFLVVVTAFILSGISGDTFGSQLYWTVAVHLLVIFYGIELALVFYRNSRKANLIQVMFSLPLAVLMIRGIFF